MRWARQLLVPLVAVVVVAAMVDNGSSAGAAAQPAPAPIRRPPVFLMGDSTMLIMWYHPDSQAVISEAYQHVPDFESCRRIITPSCRGRFGYVPPNVITTMRANEGRLGETLVIMAGYDDGNIEPGIDVVMAEARRQGVTAVLWLTYTTNTTYVGPGGQGFAAQFAEHNRDLAAAAAEYPDLHVADWDTFSAPHREWFEADGIHMTRAGAFGLAAYLRAELDSLYAGTVGRCTSPEALRDPLPADPSLPAGAGGIVPVAPRRLLDTRTAATMVDAGQGVTVQVPADVGTDATAAWVNVTATNGCRAGYLTAGACGAASDTSTTNYGPGESRPGLALVPLDADGRFCVRASTRGDVAVDLFAVQGAAGAGAALVPTAAERVLDTRTGAPVAAGVPVAVDVGAPDGSTGVFASLTVVAASGPTFAAMFPAAADGSCSAGEWDGTSNVNVPDALAHANSVLVGLGGGGRVCVIAGQSAHVVVDRTGAIGAAGTGPVTEARRLLDTRVFGSALTARSVVTVATGGGADQPVLLNLTATDAGAPGYLAVVPPVGAGCPAAGGDGTSTSTVNVAPGAVRANLALTRTGAAGQVCVFTYGPTHVVADLVAS